MKISSALLIALIILQTASAESTESICHELDQTIDNSIRQVALNLAEGDIVDKGAMQQASRYISANNHLQVIQISLNLQSQHKCPIRKSVINPLIYTSEARKCIFATARQEEDVPALCDFKNWKGDSK